jgi:transcriptional regulator with XRE-family HTH domain
VCAGQDGLVLLQRADSVELVGPDDPTRHGSDGGPSPAERPEPDDPDPLGLGELHRISAAEQLLIWRKRANLNQREMAKRFGVSRNRYSQFENYNLNMLEEPTLLFDLKEYAVGPLRANERCLLYRRRCGVNQRQVANHIGLSRLWVNRMERGIVDCSRLIEYWEV